VSVTWTLDGLDEAVHEFDRFPTDSANEARAIIGSAAQGAAAAIQAAYPVVSGELRAGVGVEPLQQDQLYAGDRVVSRSDHAHVYEYGSQLRRTAQGWGRGVMPRPPTFIFGRELTRARAGVGDGLTGILARGGLVVEQR
jgi:hypothetical protein